MYDVLPRMYCLTRSTGIEVIIQKTEDARMMTVNDDDEDYMATMITMDYMYTIDDYEDDGLYVTIIIMLLQLVNIFTVFSATTTIIKTTTTITKNDDNDDGKEY
ncbi:hypothetical protein BZA77DRAFT_293675 [Pyronema omphalodes]|nr:hypothetical protein BZA77DRAFT_293675 [Pyronema omphalodes]